jgi:nicotinamide riboside kinase
MPASNQVIFITILGAESTGKTTLLESLVEGLAAELKPHCFSQVLIVPELLRAFCIAKRRTPTRTEQADLFAQQQTALAATAARAAASLTQPADRCLVLCDGAPITTALYSDQYFHDDSLIAAATTAHQRFALSFVLRPEFAWQADPIPYMRDSSQAQEVFDHGLQAWIAKSKIPHLHLKGDTQTRCSAAQSAMIKLIR